MMTGLKVVPILALLTSGASLAQATTPSTSPKPSSHKSSQKQKMMVMDPKMHEQMMSDAKRMDEQVQELKRALAEERKKGIDPAHHAEMMGQQKASDQQIEALQNTIKSLRHQIETAPHYLEQTTPQG